MRTKRERRLVRDAPPHGALKSRWGGFWLLGGAEASALGWLAQWLVLVFFGGLAFETALIKWGLGTWPQRDTPWISLSLIIIALLVMTVDIVVVGLHNWRFERRQRTAPNGPTAR